MACRNNVREAADHPEDPGALKESLVRANQHVVDTEDEQIRNLVTRYGWQMKETGTGLRYLIYHEGNGPKATTGDIAGIQYEVRLISGDVVYSSRASGIKKFKIGSGGVESGLEEGILLLRRGDKAKMILPSHLAWGLIGDQDKIPPKSTLIYDLELISLEKQTAK
jgi:FKBP-type peptidyl-prolyl cis-trans isomerase